MWAQSHTGTLVPSEAVHRPQAKGCGLKAPGSAWPLLTSSLTFEAQPISEWKAAPPGPAGDRSWRSGWPSEEQREGEDDEKTPNGGFFQCARLEREDGRGFEAALGCASAWT